MDLEAPPTSFCAQTKAVDAALKELLQGRGVVASQMQTDLIELGEERLAAWDCVIVSEVVHTLHLLSHSLTGSGFVQLNLVMYPVGHVVQHV